MAKRMTEEELKTLVAMEQRQSLGYTSSKLAAARQRFAYDAETGVLTYKVRRGCMAAGKEAGSLRQDGYVDVKVDGRSYLAHRVIWLLVHGEWPKGDIDHINGVKTDNRLCNLRDVTASVNCQNKRKARADNSTGLLGVSRAKDGFIAQIWVGGKQRKLGKFTDPQEAHMAYVSAKRALHAGCAI